MLHPSQLTSRGEREYRDQLVRGVSRTFALSIEVLPGVLRDAVSVAYLCFRVADGIEDHATMPPDRKAGLLRLWASVLQGEASVEQLSTLAAGLDSRDPEVTVVQHAPLILNWLDALPESFGRVVRGQTSASSLGMARWQEHGPFVEDEVALDDYMHEVAGRVGYLVTDLYALHIPAVMARRDQMMPLSHECGLALQTVNVLRGLRTDYERGWVFVPETTYRSCGLTRETLFQPYYSDRTMHVVTLLAEKARRHLDNGYEYVCSFPRSEHSARLSLMWPFLFAARTLAVCRNNPLTLTSEAKMSRAEVREIVLKSRMLGWSNGWLHQTYLRLLEAPLAQPGAPPVIRIPTPEGT
jgi:farnesyl-diphosphate farnesyltransferase